MRFLADAGVSPKTVDFLLGIGHEAIHVSTIGMQTAEDRALIQRAVVDRAVILTFDLDFGAILDAGALILIEDTRCRIRKLPIGP